MKHSKELLPSGLIALLSDFRSYAHVPINLHLVPALPYPHPKNGDIRSSSGDHRSQLTTALFSFYVHVDKQQLEERHDGCMLEHSL